MQLPAEAGPDVVAAAVADVANAYPEAVENFLIGQVMRRLGASGRIEAVRAAVARYVLER